MGRSGEIILKGDEIGGGEKQIVSLNHKITRTNQSSSRFPKGNQLSYCCWILGLLFVIGTMKPATHVHVSSRWAHNYIVRYHRVNSS